MAAIRPSVLIALTSLAAEGTPVLALELCRVWKSWGLEPILIVLEATPTDLVPDFEALGIEQVVLDLPKQGYLRYLRLAVSFFALARRYRARALLSMPLGWHSFMAVGAR